MRICCVSRWALLCSLGKQAAGTNLQVANHIVFVHPLLGRSDRQIGAWEAQAIGRCHRPGQQKRVEVHRFIAVNTLEAVLHSEREPRLWSTHFKLNYD